MALCFLIFSTVVQAEEPITFGAFLEKSEAVIGDQINYSLDLKWNTAEIDEPKVIINKSNSKFEFDAELISEVEKVDSIRRSQRFSYKIFTFEEGDLETPIFEINYRPKKSTDSLLIQTKPLIVQVSLLPPDNEEDPNIRAIATVMELPKDPIPWGWIIAGVVAGLFITGLLVFLYFRYFQKPEVYHSTVPTIPIEQQAYQDLYRLEESRLLAQEKFKAYFEELSRILRTYLGARYAFPAIDMTSYEIHLVLLDSLKEAEIKNLDIVCERCDSVKFAKWIPPVTVGKQSLELVRALVEATTPVSINEIEQEKKEVEMAGEVQS